MNKKDQNQLELGQNISEEHSLSTTQPKAVVSSGGVNIAGLEGIPANMIAVPFVRLVQPSSKRLELSDGSEAPVGSFLFNDTQKATTELDFVLLGAKHQLVETDEKGKFVRQDHVGKIIKKPRVVLLGALTESNKVFILSLSSTSFSNFGKLLARLKDIQADKTWRFSLKAVSEKTENDKGKYCIVNFKDLSELPEEKFLQMEQLASEFGQTLERQDLSEDE